MGFEHAVVVIDTGTPRQLVRCVREVVSTVDPWVTVVVVSRKHPSLGGLARRVRRAQVRSGQSLEQVARAEALPGRLTVVARSECRFTSGWLGLVERRMVTAEASVAVLGEPVRFVEVYVGVPAVATAAPIDLEIVPGIGLPMRGGSSGVGTVTISASLIVKDEEEGIQRCLAAVKPFVDEVVVYVTGITDRTVELAEAAGAVVIRGYWDDDFGAARNRSLEHCSGDWILPVDADEVVQGDPAALRRFLGGARGDLVRVELVNVTWDGADDGDEYVVERLFRRSAAVWHGAIHERIVPQRSQRRLTTVPSVGPLRLMHLGYTADRMQAKSKGERNLAIARAQVESGADSASAWCDYGRSLALAGRPEEALDALGSMFGKPAPSSTFVLAGRTALECLYGLSNPDDTAERWFTALAEHGEAPGRIALERARLALRQGRVADAAELLTDLSTATDCWGVPFDPDEAAGLRAEVLYRQGRGLESLELLRSTIDRNPGAVPLTMQMLAVMRAEVPLENVARQVPEQFLLRSLREVLHLDPANADAWLDAVWAARGDARVLVAAELVCRGLRIERVLVWEMRCMESGTPVSPLRSIAGDETASISSRCLAHAVLGDVLGDATSQGESERLLERVPEEEMPVVLRVLREVAPGAFEGLTRAAEPATAVAQ
jgi:hypothetical protein